MKSRSGYIPGNRWQICDICGFEYRFSEMRPGVDRQKGYKVCPDCYDPPEVKFKYKRKPEKTREIV